MTIFPHKLMAAIRTVSQVIIIVSAVTPLSNDNDKATMTCTCKWHFYSSVQAS